MSMPAPVPEAPKPEEQPKAPETRSAPVAKAATQPDRWSEMAREVTACEEKGAVAQVFCVDRVRWKYCSDYWNKVPQCMVTGIKP